MHLFYNLGQNTWDKSQNCTTSIFDYVPPAPPVSMLLDSNAIRPSQHWIRGKGDEKVLNVCFHLDIVRNMKKAQKFASVPICFDQDCTVMWHFNHPVNSICASQKCSARLTRILFMFRIPQYLRCSFSSFYQCFKTIQSWNLWTVL